MKRLLAAASAIPMLFQPAMTSAQSSTPQTGSAHDFAFTAIEGRPMPLSAFKGKVLLIVNTASFCGFTKQYDALQKVHAKYEARGFAVIGVPSNDFGDQEPGSAKQIKEFCESKFGITFPMTEKSVVKGPNAIPLYRWAKASLPTENEPKWNFHKILIGKDGKLGTEPLDNA